MTKSDKWDEQEREKSSFTADDFISLNKSINKKDMLSMILKIQNLMLKHHPGHTNMSIYFICGDIKKPHSINCLQCNFVYIFDNTTKKPWWKFWC